MTPGCLDSMLRHVWQEAADEGIHEGYIIVSPLTHDALSRAVPYADRLIYGYPVLLDTTESGFVIRIVPKEVESHSD